MGPDTRARIAWFLNVVGPFLGLLLVIGLFSIRPEVRAGFLTGVKLSRPAKEVQAELLEVGILAGTSTDPNVLRLLPPFILEEQHVDLLRDALTHLA